MVIWYLIYVRVIWGHYICDGNSLGLTVIAEHTINSLSSMLCCCILGSRWWVMVIWYLIYVGVIWGHYICDGNSLGLRVIAEHAINTD